MRRKRRRPIPSYVSGRVADLQQPFSGSRKIEGFGQSEKEAVGKSPGR